MDGGVLFKLTDIYTVRNKITAKISLLLYNKRIENKLSLDDMADLLYIDSKTLMEIESGKHDIRLTEIIKISHYLNISLKELIGEDVITW